MAIQLNTAVNNGIIFLEERCDQNGFQYDCLGKDSINFIKFNGKYNWPLENHHSILGLEFIGHLLSPTKLRLLTDFAKPSSGPMEINHFVNHVWVPNDAENTAIRISYFLKVGLFSIKDTHKMAKLVVSNIVPQTGEIQIYLPPRGAIRENRIDYTSSCISIRFLYMVGMRDEAIQTENAIFTFLTSKAFLKGCWSYYAPESFLCFCAHAVKENSAALERFQASLTLSNKSLNPILKINFTQI